MNDYVPMSDLEERLQEQVTERFVDDRVAADLMLDAAVSLAKQSAVLAAVREWAEDRLSGPHAFDDDGVPQYEGWDESKGVEGERAAAQTVLNILGRS